MLCDILHIPLSKRQEIEQESSSDDQQSIIAIKWWLLTDPLASWRGIVHALYDMFGCVDLNLDTVGDRIRHYTEELTGMYTT